MPKFRKRTNVVCSLACSCRPGPVVIEAVQFNGQNFDEVEDFLCGNGAVINGVLTIATLEGGMRASMGDWIIKGVKGEFYPIKPAVFAASYDAVPDLVCDPSYDLDRA